MAHDTLYIVDNSGEKASVKNYLSEWCSISKQMDIATGYFEIGGLLTLGEEWQKLDKIRIILGNEVTKRTKEVIEEVAKVMIERFRESVEREQEKNELLIGIPAIINAMKSGKIKCRVYDSNKFHAKAYITYFRDEYRNQFISAMNVPSGYALVGSSNFTKAGLTQNIELNVQVKDEVEQLQNWFEEHWENGTDITEAVLKVMENHCRKFSPYDVYLRSMYEYFKSHEETVSEWEENESVVYKGLSQYQKDGYNSLIQIAEHYSGAFLCDGVGLGKTYVGMMLIERFVKKERKNVVLIIPASARVSVWEVTIKRLIPEILEGFYPFKIINHTDLLLDKNQNLMNQIAQQAEIIIIDEAHHFRNRSSNRYRKLFEMMQAGCQKQMFMLTATPINNSFLDLQHLIELFTHRQEDYFSAAPLGIHSLAGHFKKMEKQLDQVSGTAISDSLDISGDIIRADKLVTELVVQRSRAYVKRSLLTEQGNNVLFSKREPPTVANYKLFKDFKDNLIHDMTKQQFADMYAQTVVYGLFSARCMDKTQDSFNVKEAIACIPNTNPFLKRLMEECLGESSERHLTFDELEVANVVEILTHTNSDLILADFNRQTGGGREDPVIHFYEEFLTAYDKGQKVDRGVFYTPQPVVNFIVRAVDSILKNDLELEDGLASEQTKDIMIEVEGKKRRERCEVPAVQILDPATGTGTFLRQTILQIYDNFRAKHKCESEEQIRKAWNEYVPKHLLPRLNGFELMMAPYAVAHMKLAMVLKDTGYDFSGDQRLNVFLTNSLEEAGKDDFQMTLFDNDPLAFESIEANQAKKNNGINVIIGNPPYNVSSNNKNPWISDLIQEYKRGLSERKLNLDDDYIKFLRLAQTIVEGADKGVVGFITNNSFIDGITHRQIRKSLANTFDRIYIINLHGNIMAHEKCPDGSKDENVFPITQGVSIFIGVRNKAVKVKGAYHIDVMGIRDYKFNWLNQNIIDEIHWSALSLDDDKCMFVPVNVENRSVYNNGFSLSELFILFNSGTQTKFDALAVSTDRNELLLNISRFKEWSVEQLKQTYERDDSRDWTYKTAKADVLNDNYKIVRYTYRPFDLKYIYYSGCTKGIVAYPRRDTMEHMIKGNIGLCLMRQFFQSILYNHVFISENIIDERTLYSNRGGTYLFPLYLYSSELGENKKEYNFNCGIISEIEQSLGLKLAYSIQENHFTGENLIDYIYAVLYSNKYRLAYNDFLKVDFPRVPYPTDQETFWKLVEIGGKLRECHLMQTEFDIEPYSFIGDGTNEVVKSEYKNGRVYISKTQYFDNVPQAQWEQYIGGYQPLQKWLKDRKKTMLSAEDIEHYKKIIAALKLTEELMAEIDQVVEF